MTSPALLRAVAALLDNPATVVFHGATCRPKLPATCPGAERASQPFHQDSQYFDDGKAAGDCWSTADMHIVSCWLPLGPVSKRSGCLEVRCPEVPSNHCQWMAHRSVQRAVFGRFAPLGAAGNLLATSPTLPSSYNAAIEQTYTRAMVSPGPAALTAT